MMKELFAVMLMTVLSGCANYVFYQPDKVQYTSPEKDGLKFEDVYFPSRDRTRLHGWLIPAVGQAKGTVIHFHGNGQNISAHFGLVSWLPREGYNLFTFDYRGYGKSEGRPSRKGLQMDSVAAVEYVCSRSDVNRNIYVLGQSLGGANAISALHELKKTCIRGVIIESTFASYQEIAADKARLIPLLGSLLSLSPALLATNDYSPAFYVKDMAPVPMFFIHGTNDRVISINHSHKLYSLAKDPKELMIMPDGRHLEAFSRFLPETRPRILAFMGKYREAPEQVIRQEVLRAAGCRS